MFRKSPGLYKTIILKNLKSKFLSLILLLHTWESKNDISLQNRVVWHDRILQSSDSLSSKILIFL